MSFWGRSCFGLPEPCLRLNRWPQVFFLFCKATCPWQKDVFWQDTCNTCHCFRYVGQYLSIFVNTSWTPGWFAIQLCTNVKVGMRWRTPSRLCSRMHVSNVGGFNSLCRSPQEGPMARAIKSIYKPLFSAIK